MTKYYKQIGEGIKSYFILDKAAVLSIDIWDDGQTEMGVIELPEEEKDLSIFEHCQPSEALSAFHRFENRCKEIINSTGL